MAAVLAACSFGVGTEARAELIRHSTSGDLFYNYYVPPVGGERRGAMYPCPRPTPPLVGHTYVTYPPLARTSSFIRTARLLDGARGRPADADVGALGMAAFAVVVADGFRGKVDGTVRSTSRPANLSP